MIVYVVRRPTETDPNGPKYTAAAFRERTHAESCVRNLPETVRLQAVLEVHLLDPSSPGSTLLRTRLGVAR
jgi:hypothetical protein